MQLMQALQSCVQGGQQYAPQPTGGSQYMAQQYAPAPPQQQQQSPLRYVWIIAYKQSPACSFTELYTDKSGAYGGK